MNSSLDSSLVNGQMARSKVGVKGVQLLSAASFLSTDMLFLPYWYQEGIKKISDLFDSCVGHFLTFNSFCNKFNVKCSFLQYYSILSSIPQKWKKLLQECSKDSATPPSLICSLSCRAIYSILLNLEDPPPSTSEKKRLASGVEESDLTKIYLLPFKATTEIKLVMFKHKIIHLFYQQIACYTKLKMLPRPSVPYVLLSVRPCGIC